MEFKFSHKGYEYTLFFVLNGLINGEEGELAQRSGTGEQLKDGWYFLMGDDVDGDGPYEHKDEARMYAELGIGAEDERLMYNEVAEFVARLRNRDFDVATITDAFNVAIKD